MVTNETTESQRVASKTAGMEPRGSEQLRGKKLCGLKDVEKTLCKDELTELDCGKIRLA